ncbi:MAG: hypothetical protein ACR2GK_03010 [Gemmatimonadaceae bacterium]
MSEEEGYSLAHGALDEVKNILNREYEARTGNFGNARLVRNLFERSLTSQANRLVNSSPSRDDLCTLTASDIGGP